LIIGYGNLLRQDDGVGQRIAEAIAAWKEAGIRSPDLSAVESVSVHQLTPDLAEPLSSVEQVIFVDACYSTATEQVSVHRLELTETLSPLGHTCTPQSVLALAMALYGHAPQACLVQVPGKDFELGDRLSETAERNMAEALKCIQAILQEPSLCFPSFVSSNR
jgi:hydrogenase maturation protease